MTEFLEKPQELEAEIKERVRTAEALQQSEEYFRLLVEVVKDYAIIRLDPGGHVQSWNAGAENIKGYRAAEIIGQHFSRFYPAADIHQGKPEIGLKTAIDKGRHEDEGWRVRKDGSRFWANVVMTALKNEAGNLQGFSKITRDLSERRRADEALRQSEERANLIVEKANDAFITMDAWGAIIAWNGQAEATFGWLRGEVLGRPLAETLIPPQYREAHVRGLQRFFASGEGPVLNKRIELTALHRDGHEFPVELTICPLQVGGMLTFNAFVHDITERKRVDEKLALFARQLQRSNLELEQFASIASHDLQEPLRKIQSFGDRLQAKCGDALGAQGLEYLERMQASAARMRTLINDLLAFSRLSTRPRNFVPVHFARLVAEVVSDLEESIHQSGGRVDVGELPAVDVDPVQMRQVLQNLIGNGLKFRRPGVGAAVKVEGKLLSAPADLFGNDGSRGPVYQITVQDNGIGFDEIYLDRIFEAFQRLHGRNEYEGTGMGLAICRKIVEGHGGQITAKSVPGQGATFIITLPGNQAKEERQHETESAAHYHSDG